MTKDILIAIGLIEKTAGLIVEKCFEPIPYIKELKKLKQIKHSNDCIFMAKLELLFLVHSGSFCKYTLPCKAQDELQGLSWREELGMNKSEFEEVRNRLVTRYKTKEKFLASKNKFKGKFYCCYLDKTGLDNKTYYVRNDELVDLSLLELLTEN